MKITLNSLKCDWYGATFNNLKHILDVEINFIDDVRLMFEEIYMQDVIFIEANKGFRGYPSSGAYHFIDVSTGQVGDQICLVGYNSPNPVMGVHISVSGKYSDEFRTAVIDKMQSDPRFKHRVSRCDVAFDFIELDSVDDVFDRFKEFAKKRGLSTHYEGDWDYGEKGRTYYIGSPQAKIRIVLYEKGKQQLLLGNSPDDMNKIPMYKNWLRLEVRVSGGKGRGDKIPYCDLKEIMFASRNVKDLVNFALSYFDFDQLQPELLKIVAKENSPLTSFHYMCDTYRNVMRTVLHTQFADDRTAFLDYLAVRVFNGDF